MALAGLDDLLDCFDDEEETLAALPVPTGSVAASTGSADASDGPQSDHAIPAKLRLSAEEIAAVWRAKNARRDKCELRNCGVGGSFLKSERSGIFSQVCNARLTSAEQKYNAGSASETQISVVEVANADAAELKASDEVYSIGYGFDDDTLDMSDDDDGGGSSWRAPGSSSSNNMNTPAVDAYSQSHSSSPARKGAFSVAAKQKHEADQAHEPPSWEVVTRPASSYRRDRASAKETPEEIARSRRVFFAMGAVEDMKDSRCLQGCELALSKIIKASASEENAEALEKQEMPEHNPIFGQSQMELGSEHNIGWKKVSRASAKPKDAAEPILRRRLRDTLPWEKRLYGRNGFGDSVRESSPSRSSTFIDVARLQKVSQPSLARRSSKSPKRR